MTQRALVVLGLLLVSLAGLTLTGRSVFGSLSVLFAGVLIVAWAWSWAALRGLRLERTSRSLTSQVGRVFEETLSLKNDSRLPKLWVEVRDKSDLPGSWAAAARHRAFDGGRDSRLQRAPGFGGGGRAGRPSSLAVDGAHDLHPPRPVPPRPNDIDRRRPVRPVPFPPQRRRRP